MLVAEFAPSSDADDDDSDDDGGNDARAAAILRGTASHSSQSVATRPQLGGRFLEKVQQGIYLISSATTKMDGDA